METISVHDMTLHELSSYCPNIKLTYKLESCNKLAFLDVSARRTNDNKVAASDYMKAICTNIYKNYRSHAPSNWTIGTLTNLMKKAKSVSSSELLLKSEIIYLRHIFTEYNDFPLKVVNTIIDQDNNITDFSNQHNKKQQNPKARKLKKQYS